MVIILVFGLGCLTAPFLLGIQVLWEKFPQFDLSHFIEASFSMQSAKYIMLFVLFGAMEEIIKMYVVYFVDKKTLLIRTIGDAIKYSLAAALGFSFAENVYYLYQFWPQINLGELTGMYLFRSVFTACAHMIFSGIFGYYYGIGKFSIDITTQQKLAGESYKTTNFISKIFNISLSHAYQQEMVIKGLFIAIAIHAFYNFLLQFNIVFPIIILVAIGYMYLQYLLSRKAGHLILATDISSKRRSSIAKKDEDVVIELMGLWFKEKKYVDVLHICERLLERDPDNNVVKLFKAQALDRMNEKDTYKKILETVIKSKESLSEDEKVVISRYTEQKEAIKKSSQTLSQIKNPSPQPQTQSMQDKEREDDKSSFDLHLQ
ncbi:MAG: PrsW family glutamic-type intramembrane protease [Candidatus Gracilibacteria bacterium]|nr:PrsW family glutamic-type intramembrane protease [Candidatus Gracilibacteria bacterium]